MADKILQYRSRPLLHPLLLLSDPLFPPVSATARILVPPVNLTQVSFRASTIIVCTFTFLALLGCFVRKTHLIKTTDHLPKPISSLIFFLIQTDLHTIYAVHLNLQSSVSSSTKMEANAGLVAGSHKRNELVRIRHDSDSGVCFFSLNFHFRFRIHTYIHLDMSFFGI